MRKQAKQLTKARKYWYVTETTTCVLCGKEKKDKFRVYTMPKPEQKHTFKDYACGEHFM